MALVAVDMAVRSIHDSAFRTISPAIAVPLMACVGYPFGFSPQMKFVPFHVVGRGLANFNPTSYNPTLLHVAPIAVGMALCWKGKETLIQNAALFAVCWALEKFICPYFKAPNVTPVQQLPQNQQIGVADVSPPTHGLTAPAPSATLEETSARSSQSGAPPKFGHATLLPDVMAELSGSIRKRQENNPDEVAE